MLTFKKYRNHKYYFCQSDNPWIFYRISSRLGLQVNILIISIIISNSANIHWNIPIIRTNFFQNEISKKYLQLQYFFSYVLTFKEISQQQNYFFWTQFSRILPDQNNIISSRRNHICSSQGNIPFVRVQFLLEPIFYKITPFEVFFFSKETCRRYILHQ